MRTHTVTHQALIFRGEDDVAIEITVEADIIPEDRETGIPKYAQIIEAFDESGKSVKLTDDEEERIGEEILGGQA